MENQLARRRMNMIVAHFATNEQPTTPPINPLNCSASMNSPIRRCDNRMTFARQGSTSQAPFMRPVSVKENLGRSSGFQTQIPPCSSSATKDSLRKISGVPLFSRPDEIKPELNTVEQHSPVRRECQLSMEEPPKFSRPYRGLAGQGKDFSKKMGHAGMMWSPKMDIAESRRYYVLTVELPGVNINNTRVEVDDRNLIVMGKRTTQWWRGARGSENWMPTYQKREISEGPYQVVWPLPSNVNKDGISAEFVDGFLRIILPKV